MYYPLQYYVLCTIRCGSYPIYIRVAKQLPLKKYGWYPDLGWGRAWHVFKRAGGKWLHVAKAVYEEVLWAVDDHCLETKKQREEEKKVSRE
jgi:hypothetical protein